MPPPAKRRRLDNRCNKPHSHSTALLGGHIGVHSEAQACIKSDQCDVARHHKRIRHASQILNVTVRSGAGNATNPDTAIDSTETKIPTKLPHWSTSVEPISPLEARISSGKLDLRAARVDDTSLRVLSPRTAQRTEDVRSNPVSSSDSIASRAAANAEDVLRAALNDSSASLPVFSSSSPVDLLSTVSPPKTNISALPQTVSQETLQLGLDPATETPLPLLFRTVISNTTTADVLSTSTSPDRSLVTASSSASNVTLSVSNHSPITSRPSFPTSRSISNSSATINLLGTTARVSQASVAQSQSANRTALSLPYSTGVSIDGAHFITFVNTQSQASGNPSSITSAAGGSRSSTSPKVVNDAGSKPETASPGVITGGVVGGTAGIAVILLLLLLLLRWYRKRPHANHLGLPFLTESRDSSRLQPAMIEQSGDMSHFGTPLPTGFPHQDRDEPITSAERSVARDRAFTVLSGHKMPSPFSDEAAVSVMNPRRLTSNSRNSSQSMPFSTRVSTNRSEPASSLGSYQNVNQNLEREDVTCPVEEPLRAIRHHSGGPYSPVPRAYRHTPTSSGPSQNLREQQRNESSMYLPVGSWIGNRPLTPSSFISSAIEDRTSSRSSRFVEDI